MTTRVAKYNCTAPTLTKGFGSPAKGPRPRLAKYDASSAAEATIVVHQRGGRRNAATITSASSTKGRSRTVVSLLGGAENTQIVIPSSADAISANSAGGGIARLNSRLRQRIAQPMITGAMHKDPSQFPAHHSCHSRK